jgi:hypothetical protein
MRDERDTLMKRIATFIDRLAMGGRDDKARDALLCDVLQWQTQVVPPYRKFIRATGLEPCAEPRNVDSFPALPTDVFRYTRVAWHEASADRAVFRTSGTTLSVRGSHYLYDLSLYDRAAHAAARYALFPDVQSVRLFVLAPANGALGESSLSYMLERFISWFGDSNSAFMWRDDDVDIDRLACALDDAVAANEPVALVGTSLAFVHAFEAFQNRAWRLAPGSRIMQTGGFKGKIREIDSGSLRASLSNQYGIEDAYIIQEYGMTELCSQMYETTLRDAVEKREGYPRRFWTPGWMRISIVEPETLRPVRGDAPGLLRIDDLANLDSVCSIQTSDLAIREGDSFVLLGRATGSVPRGCSIVLD